MNVYTHTRTHLHIDLAVRDGAQRGNELRALLPRAHLRQDGQALLHHVRDDLLQLRAALGKDQHVRVQLRQVAHIPAQPHSLHSHARRGKRVARHARALLQRQQPLQRAGQVAALRMGVELCRGRAVSWEGEFVCATSLVAWRN